MCALLPASLPPSPSPPLQEPIDDESLAELFPPAACKFNPALVRLYTALLRCREPVQNSNFTVVVQACGATSKVRCKVPAVHMCLLPFPWPLSMRILQHCPPSTFLWTYSNRFMGRLKKLRVSLEGRFGAGDAASCMDLALVAVRCSRCQCRATIARPCLLRVLLPLPACTLSSLPSQAATSC